MDNCALDGTRTCYVEIAPSNCDGDGGPAPAPAPDLRRDAYLFSSAVLLACIAIALYNHCVVVRARRGGGEDARPGGKRKNAGRGEEGKRLLGMLAEVGSGSTAELLASVEGMGATGDFFSAIFSHMWEQMKVAVSNKIKNQLEPSLKDMAVPLNFIKLDLGNVPLKTANMFIHRAFDDAGVEKQAGIQVDFDVLWDGNCDIMLQATVSRSMKLTFGVKNIKLDGRMHVLLCPLTTEMPVVAAVQYGFTNPPKVELKLTGVARGLKKFFPSINSALVGVIQSSLASMLVLPHRQVYPLDLGSYDFLDAYRPPVGMVRLRAMGGRGFKVLQKGIRKDIPDIYCIMSLGASGTFRPNFRTSTKIDNMCPDWSDESCDFILYDLDQIIYTEVWDEDTIGPGCELGRVAISVRDLFKNKGSAELELELNGTTTGCFVTLSAELFHLSTELGSLSSPDYCEKDHLCGLVTIFVIGALDVPIFPKADAATFVQVVYGEGTRHEKTFKTGVVADYPGVDALNPMYDCVFRVPINAKMLRQEDEDVVDRSCSDSTVGSMRNSMRNSLIGLFDGRSRYKPNDIVFTLIATDGVNGSKGRGELGRLVVTQESLIAAYKHTIKETMLIGNDGAKLEFRVTLNGMHSEKEKQQAIKSPKSSEDEEVMLPMSLYGGMEESNGVKIRVTVLRGRGFKIRERFEMYDMPDVYCAIDLNPSRKNDDREDQPWRTCTIKDDTMPRWNEYRDYDNVHPSRDVIRVCAYQENEGKDEYLGAIYLSIEKLLRKRLLEAELRKGANATKGYITLMCVRREEERASATDAGSNSLSH